MKTFGYILAIGGLIATIISVINYLNESETFSVLGLDVAVSKGDPTAIIISVAILLVGFFFINASKNK